MVYAEQVRLLLLFSARVSTKLGCGIVRPHLGFG